jgi:ABC-type transporter Mla MlaB component
MVAPTSEPVIFIGAQLAPSDLPGLHARACELLEVAEAATIVCDVRDVAADAVTVDALARLRLAARRRGCRMRLRNASPELLGLIALIGLDDALLD